MKKFVLIAVFILILTGMSANALTIETKSSHVVLINGTRIDSNYISQITFNDSNDTTSITFENGKIITFKTNYNEYLQIQQACYPSEYSNSNTDGTYTTPPSVYWPGWGNNYNVSRPIYYNNGNTNVYTHTNNNTNNSNGNSGTSSGSHSTTLPSNAIMAPSASAHSQPLIFESHSITHFP